MYRLRSSRNVSVIWVVAIVCSVAWLGVVGHVPRPAEAAVDYVFNVNCPVSHYKSDDPIVFAKVPGASHRHAFYGNSTTDAYSTTSSLLASRSTCERGFDTADRSAYWIPSLYRKLPDGRLQEVRLSGDDQHLSAYYRRTGGPTGDKVSPFPKGLRMIAGDPHATRPQDTIDVAWRCNGDGRDSQADLPNCAAGTLLQALVSFPDCWDGKNLDSPNHRSHMTISRGDRGSCPASHPKKLPQLTFEVSFNLPPVAGSTYELSSGGRYSLHGDFFAAWDDRVQSALVNSCLNKGKFCYNLKRSEVNLAAATPVKPVPEPTTYGFGRLISPAPAGHADHAVHATPSAGRSATPAATVAAVRRVAVSSIAASVAVAMLAGSALCYWRRRALRRRT